MGQITVSPSKGYATEKGEPMTVRAAQHWSSDLHFVKQFTRDNDPPLQPICPTQIPLAQYLLVDASTWGFGGGISMPKEVINGMEDSPVRVHARHGFWCEEHQSNSSKNRELRSMVKVVEEEVEAGRMEGVELLFMTDQSVTEQLVY